MAATFFAGIGLGLQDRSKGAGDYTDVRVQRKGLRKDAAGRKGNSRSRGPTACSMLGDDCRIDAAADIEFRRQPHEARREQLHQVIENSVCHSFVERAFVAERPDIKFQRFQFDARICWNVLEEHCGEVGLTCLRTETGELRQPHPNRVVALRIRIRKRLESFVRRPLGGLPSHVFSSDSSGKTDRCLPSLLDRFLLYTTGVDAAIAAGPCSTTTGLSIAPE